AFDEIRPYRSHNKRPDRDDVDVSLNERSWIRDGLRAIGVHGLTWDLNVFTNRDEIKRQQRVASGEDPCSDEHLIELASIPRDRREALCLLCIKQNSTHKTEVPKICHCDRRSDTHDSVSLDASCRLAARVVFVISDHYAR